MKVSKLTSLLICNGVIIFFFFISLAGNLEDIIFGGFPMRKVTYLFLVLLVNVIYLNREKNIYLIGDLFVINFGFLFILLYGVIIPLLKNNEYSNAIKDLFPYVIPFMAIPLGKIITEAEFHIIQRGIGKIIFVIGLLHLLGSLAYIVNDNFGNVVYYALRVYFNDSESSEFTTPDFNNSILLPRMQFWVSVSFVLYFYICLKRFMFETGLSKQIYLLFSLVFILCTQSRALVFGLIVIPVMYKLINAILKYNRNINMLTLMTFVLLFAPLVITAIIVVFDPMYILGLSRDHGDELRLIQLVSLFDAWSNNPFWGISFGQHAEIIRNKESPWVYELNLIATLFKVGVIGFISVMFYLYYSIQRLTSCGLSISNINIFDIQKVSLAMSCIFYFCLISNSNPYLNNFLGGFILMLMLTDIAVVCKGKVIKNENKQQ